jgi:hypothetical protein
MNQKHQEVVSKFNDYLHGLYFTIIIGGILFINIGYLLKRTVAKNNSVHIYGT